MYNNRDICKLSDLKIGQVAIIVELCEENREIKRHLLDMGLTRGTKVEIKKIAPMGDPITLFFRDYELSICKKDLEKIKIKIIN